MRLMLSLPTRWRVWLTALLLLALPLQSLAVSSMLGCGGAAFGRQAVGTHAHAGHRPTAGHRTHQDNAKPAAAPQQAVVHTAGHSASSDQAMQPAEHAVARGEVVHHTTHGAHPTSTVQAKQTDQTDTGCSACAACFVGAALATAEAVFSSPQLPQMLMAGSSPRRSGTSPDGLERPPRKAQA